MEGDVQEYPHIWICGLHTFLVMREISCVERRLAMLKVCRSAVGVCCDLHSLCYRDVQILELLAVENAVNSYNFLRIPRHHCPDQFILQVMYS